MRTTRLALAAGIVASLAVAAPGAAAKPGSNTAVAIGDASPDHEELCLYEFTEEVESDDPDAEDGETETITYYAALGRTDFGGPMTMWPPNHKGQPWAFEVDQSGEGERMMPTTSVAVRISHSTYDAAVPVDSLVAGTATSFYIGNDGETAMEGSAATTMEFIPDTEELDARGGVMLDFFGEVLAERDGRDKQGRTYFYAYDVEMSFVEADQDGDGMMDAQGGACILAAKDGSGGYVLDNADDEYGDDPDEDPNVASDRRTRTAYAPRGYSTATGTFTTGPVTTIQGPAYTSYIPHDMRGTGGANGNGNGGKPA